MKSKFFLSLSISLISICLWGQTQSGYLPFHEYLLKNHGNIQKSGGGSARDIAFEKIGYVHFTFAPFVVPPSWDPADSGVYNFYAPDTTYVVETGANYYEFADSADWVNSALDTFTDGGYGQIETMTHELYSNGQYADNYMYSYSYYTTAPVGYLNTETFQTWNNGAPVDSFEYIYTYDTIGRLTGLVSKTGSTLQNDSQYLYTYAGYNNNVLLTQAWNGTAWVNVFKQNNSFDAHGNNYQSFVLSWNGSGWDNYALIIKGFDLQNELVSYVSELWNADSGAYVNSYQEAYAYTLGNATQFENFTWSAVNNAWTPISLNTYGFDEDHNCVIEQDDTFNLAADSFQNADLYYYYYNTFEVSGIKEVQNNEPNLSIFPNPSNGDNALLSYTSTTAGNITVNIYDVLGKLLKRLQTNVSVGASEVPLNFSGCAGGSYFVQVIDNTGKAGVVKFVKQ